MIYLEIIIICVVGTLLHFTYELSHHNKIVAVFSAVNESTWEHIKICMTSTLLYSIYNIFKYGLNSNFIVGLSLRLLTIIVLIPCLFYLYSFFTKKSILWIDVVCFYVTVICSSLIFKYIIELEKLSSIYTYLSILLLIIEFICYFMFTFKPLKNFIFKDPISHKYGLDGHTEMDHHNHKH